MNKNQWVAVFVSLGVLAYLLFGGSLMNFIKPITINSQQPAQMTTSNDNLKVEDLVVGNGAVAEPGDKITVHYTGSLTDGTVFDNSVERKAPFTFTLGVGQVIRGWDEGIVGMKEGGKRVLVIPASLAYGDRAMGDAIPANSTLVFEVELLKVQKGAQR